MKIRDGYVSNSSSSSFVIGKTRTTRGITAKDMKDFIFDRMPSYKKLLSQSRSYNTEYPFDEFDAHAIFGVFDLTNPLEKKEACIVLKDFLEGWINNRASKKPDGTIVPHNYTSNHAYRTKKEIKEAMNKIINYKDNEGYVLQDYYLTSYSSILENYKDALHKYDEEKDAVIYKSLPEYLVEDLIKAGENCGICSNYDALIAPNAIIAVHFDENDILNITGMTDDNDDDTESYTYERFCKLFVKWMQSKYRLSLKYDWKSIFNATLMYNMHEG